jgi:hypothetical protein
MRKWLLVGAALLLPMAAHAQDHIPSARGGNPCDSLFCQYAPSPAACDAQAQADEIRRQQLQAIQNRAADARSRAAQSEAGPSFPDYNIEQICRSNPNVAGHYPGSWDERVDHCRELESLSRHIVRDGGTGLNGLGEMVHDPSWAERPADLRRYCLTYYLPRIAEFARNVGDTSQPNYTWLSVCLGTNTTDPNDPRAPWKQQSSIQSYYGQYANDPGHYYPGWHAGR